MTSSRGSWDSGRCGFRYESQNRSSCYAHTGAVGFAEGRVGTGGSQLNGKITRAGPGPSTAASVEAAPAPSASAAPAASVVEKPAEPAAAPPKVEAAPPKVRQVVPRRKKADAGAAAPALETPDELYPTNPRPLSLVLTLVDRRSPPRLRPIRNRNPRARLHQRQLLPKNPAHSE